MGSVYMYMHKQDNSPNSQVSHMSHAKDQIRSEFNFPFVLESEAYTYCGQIVSGATFESFYCFNFTYFLESSKLQTFMHLRQENFYLEIEFKFVRM